MIIILKLVNFFQLGYDFDEKTFDELFFRFKEIADKKKVYVIYSFHFLSVLGRSSKLP